MCGMAAASSAALFLIRYSAGKIGLAGAKSSWWRALVMWLVTLGILAAFPEAILRSVVAHFLTIILGNVLIAVPQTAFSAAFLPVDTSLIPTSLDSSKARTRAWVQWSGVAFFGLATGASIGALELFGEGGARPSLNQVLLVGSVFTGAGLSVLVVAFAFYRSPLGLFYRPSRS